MAPGDLARIRSLMGEAFGARFSTDDWKHALGGTHFVVRDEGGSIVAHGSVVPRRLEVSGRSLSTGYVEAVATRPALQGRGLGTAVMTAIARFLEARYELGALSASTDFYVTLGWVRWRGATWYRAGEELVRTPDEDGGVLVLPLPRTPPLDVHGDLVADWRKGDVW